MTNKTKMLLFLPYRVALTPILVLGVFLVAAAFGLAHGPSRAYRVLRATMRAAADA